jgi:hypothetical protein
MANTHNRDELPGIVNGVNGSIVADANSVFVVAAFELLAAGRTWLIGERFDTWKDSLNQMCGEPFKLFPGAYLHFDCVVSHEAFQ